MIVPTEEEYAKAAEYFGGHMKETIAQLLAEYRETIELSCSGCRRATRYLGVITIADLFACDCIQRAR